MSDGVWRPRAVPPVRGTLQQLREQARRAAEELDELRPVQRHLLRAIREPTAFVAVAPLGAGKWTAVWLGVASDPGAVWLLSTQEAVDHARQEAARLQAEVTFATFDAPGSCEARCVVVSDLHVADAPEDVLARALAAYPGVPLIVTAEPDPRAPDWAARIAAVSGRCGFVDETPYATIRWRVVAPWRDTFAPPDASVTVEALREVAMRAEVARYWCASKEAALALATSLLADERVLANDATVHPEQHAAASLRLWATTREAATVDSEVVFVAPVFDPLTIVREAATTRADDARPAGALVCADAVDLWLAAATIACARSGKLTRADVWSRVEEWMAAVSGLPEPRGVYALVVAAQINRGNATSCVRWLGSVGMAEARAALLARFGPVGSNRAGSA